MAECIRVLQVVGIMNRGGVENMLMSLYRNIDRNKVQFDFVVHYTKKGDFDNEIRSLGGKIFYAPQYTVLNHMAYKKWWAEFFKNHKEYQLIHSHIDSVAAIHLKIANRYNLVTVSHSHSSFSGKGIKGKIKNFLHRGLADIPDYLFACSQKSGEWLYGEDCRERENYFVLNNAIDTSKYVFDSQCRNEVRQELGLKDKFVVGHVGSFGFPKNHLYLLEIFKEIAKKDSRSVLVLVGDGPLREQIREKAKVLGIWDKVIMTGVRTDVNRLLQGMDCFVFPSIYEGLPVSVVEAQAAGLPCFVSENITDEVLITKLSGKISIGEEPNVWADEILKTKKNVRQNMEENIILAGYDIKTTTKWLMKFYLKAVGGIKTDFRC